MVMGEAHTLFKHTVVNVKQVPIKMYTELNITFLGLKVPNVGMLIIEYPNQLLDRKHQAMLPDIYCRMESNLSILKAFFENMEHQDLTLNVWREFSLCYSPINCLLPFRHM